MMLLLHRRKFKIGVQATPVASQKNQRLKETQNQLKIWNSFNAEGHLSQIKNQNQNKIQIKNSIPDLNHAQNLKARKNWLKIQVNHE